MMPSHRWIGAVCEVFALDSIILSALGLYGAAACGLAPLEATGTAAVDPARSDSPTEEQNRNHVDPDPVPPSVRSQGMVPSCRSRIGSAAQG